jgi:hypothetical protein
MARFQARLKTEHRSRHPELRGHQWYDVVPLWPGMKKRTHNLAGERLARLRTPQDFIMVPSSHLEFREVAAGEKAVR